MTTENERVDETRQSFSFQSGWRPALGWVCVLGFCYEFLGRPIANGLGGAFPAIDSSALNTLLFGMLGLVAARTAEKVSGVAAK